MWREVYERLIEMLKFVVEVADNPKDLYTAKMVLKILARHKREKPRISVVAMAIKLTKKYAIARSHPLPAPQTEEMSRRRCG